MSGRRRLNMKTTPPIDLTKKGLIMSVHSIHASALEDQAFFEFMAPAGGSLTSISLFLDEPEPLKGEPPFQLITNIDGPVGVSIPPNLQLEIGNNDIDALLRGINQTIQLNQYDRISFSLNLPGDVWMSFLFRLGV